MSAITVRNIPDETHRALRARAKNHGRSAEAEVRHILEETLRPSARPRLGSALAEIGRRLGGVELDITRDHTPAAGADFE